MPSQVLRCLALFCVLQLAGTTVYAGEPALWTMSDEDSTVHIFGTVHLMQEQVPWFEGAIVTAFESADTLTLEVLIEPNDLSAIEAFIKINAMLPEDKTLSGEIGSAMFEVLARSFESVGMHRSILERMRPWWASVQWLQIESAKAGFTADAGVDTVLEAKAKARGLRIRTLEQPLFQMRLLASMDEIEMKRSVSSTLETNEDIAGLFERMKSAWLDQDLDALERELIIPSREETPLFHERIFDERNRNWLPQIQMLMNLPGTHFVAVGTGHLIGEDSLVQLLREQGYQLEISNPRRPK